MCTLYSLKIKFYNPATVQGSANVPPLPLWFRGVGYTRLRERGWGGPNSDAGTYTVVLYAYMCFVPCTIALQTFPASDVACNYALIHKCCIPGIPGVKILLDKLRFKLITLRTLPYFQTSFIFPFELINISQLSKGSGGASRLEI